MKNNINPKWQIATKPMLGGEANSLYFDPLAGCYVYYLIEYYDRKELCRIRYMNNSAFPTREKAKREVELLKKADIKNREFYGFIRRIRYKIIELKVKPKT